MPFAKKIDLEFGQIGIWDINETVNALSSAYLFTEKEVHEFEILRSERRQIEYLSTRLLLQRILNQKALIHYTDKGKPYLRNQNTKLSISHCKDTVTLIVSNRDVGIDVEQVQRNIDRVAKRFLHPDEISHIQSLKDQQTAKIIYWGAKEAIFKCADLHGVQFNEQIYIYPFQINTEGHFSGRLSSPSGTQEFTLGYLLYQNNAIVYCVEQERN